MALTSTLTSCPQCQKPRAECWARTMVTKTKSIREDAAVRSIADLAITRKKPCDLFRNIEVDLSHRDLALKLGMTGPGAGKLLKKLVARGILRCNNQRKEYQTDSFTYELVDSSIGIDVCTHTYLYITYSEYIYINNLTKNNNYESININTCVQTKVPNSSGINLGILPAILRHEVSCKSRESNKILSDDSIRILLLLKSQGRLTRDLIEQFLGISSKRFRNARRILLSNELIVGDNNGFELLSNDLFLKLDLLAPITSDLTSSELKRKKVRKQQTDYREFAIKRGVIEKSELPKVRQL